jgi:hypothetical protein
VSAVADAVCHVCGIPADAGFFDASRILASPALGDEVVLAEYQMHRSYCGTLLYFAQFTDLFAADPAQVETPGLEWQIRCNMQPRDPYLTFDRIINPWGLSGFPIHLRLEEGCLIQLIVRNVAGTTIQRVGGRLLGRYWYNLAYGSLSNPR